MRGKNQWDIYFKEHKYPCIITNKETQVIVYYNREFEKLMDIDSSEIGSRIFDIIKMDEIHLTNMNPNWDDIDYFESESYNKRLHRKFKLKLSKMEDGENIFCETVPLENSLYDNVVFEKAVTECMELLETSDGNMYPKLMKMMADFYDAERAYVYRFDLDENTINCIAQWCDDPSFRVTQEVGTKIGTSIIMNWLEGENDAGIVSASNKIAYKEGAIEETILEKFDLENVTMCNIEDAKRNVVGFVGVSNRSDEDKSFDRRLMYTVSKLIAQDVANKKNESDMMELHFKDELTGCYNRTGYTHNIDKLMAKKPSMMGVVSININGLRLINEREGIAQGDRHIQKSAKRVMDHFGFEFYRMSGDELVGLAPNVSEIDFEVKAMSLYTQMRNEKNYDFSVGHAWSGERPDVMKLTSEADMLMYINKQQYYSDGKKDFDSMKDVVLAELLEHLENDEFMIYLQPQVWLKDGSLYGAEALIRMYDRKLDKMVFPDQFIPEYEEKSVIRHLDMFVLESVCKLQSEWISQGKHIPISVNFSRITLQEYGIVDSIVEICSSYNIPHELIVIEITERVGLINNNVASILVQQFKEQGFHLSLDDFGCAYSNIVTLAQIEVDEVKIDKSLVDYILSNIKNRVLVKSILAMCNELEGTATLAEGIEDAKQGELLHELGCGLGQGYHYSRPIPVSEFTDKYINNKEV